MLQYFLIFLLVVVSIFMILLIMIQRGKGGGLAGAFGGMGGQSAFGTKAGDTFTKITVVTALVWFTICILTIVLLTSEGRIGGGFDLDSDKENITAPSETGGSSASSAPSQP